ncbi:multicopper oxidase-domain-containing protein [Penicillium malachiteum]|uniref:multicopper oxidase-domain-containing protein n=1 Tax=Penicillium malachiteum TaxID=1324776 RepID=UPI0025466948|nr:multicopper oxidase-domain-containing protein [Penicillium malachiteum]KAJ5725242.1 multicopper oxidase-domain-containing protein [Penicillium malachiteum]
MERSHRRRRLPYTRESPSSIPRKSQPSSRTWLPWSLVGVILIALAYTCIQRPDLYSWESRPAPIESHRHIGATRPGIALHPEEHISRPPITQYLDWHVTSGLLRPDGVLKDVYLINDHFPGPTIEARSGDTLIITVTNGLKEDSLALHWHGLHVANAMDGAVGVSQCPIVPGAQFTYNLTISTDQSGTFWYHAHAGLSRADGLYGGLVVHSPSSSSTVRGLLPSPEDDINRYGYDKELLLLIGDWYHRPARDVLAWYKTPGNFGNEPVPDSLIINGVGHFECSMAVPARPVNCIEQQVHSMLDLDAEKTYLIRVVNTGSLAGFSLVFDKEQLDLIQIDSVDVERNDTDNTNSLGILYPGSRMDFILHPSHDHKSSSMMVQLDRECFKFVNPALTPDQTFPISYNSPRKSANSLGSISLPQIRNKVDLNYIPSAKSVLQALPPKAQQTHVVYTKIQKMARNHNIPFGYFNQTSWSPQQDSAAPLTTLPRTEWDSNQFAISTGSDPVWVDLVVNNLDEGPHPFHLHGHHFYIMTIQKPFGWGSYNPFENSIPPGLEGNLENTDENEFDSYIPYNLSRVTLRDTVQIPSRGYAVLRFRADNPGIWLFHCHVLWHQATGMAMLIDVKGGDGDGFVHDGVLGEAIGGACPVPQAT